MTDIPRLVWKAKNNSVRVVVTDRGPSKTLIWAADLPIDHSYCLEVRESSDALGTERWRMVEPYADQQVWREAFHQLAQETGLFRGGDVNEKVRELLRSAEAEL